jgi:hypothetical protein
VSWVGNGEANQDGKLVGEDERKIKNLAEPLIYLGGDAVAGGGSKRGRRRTQRRKRLRWPLPLGFIREYKVNV